MAKKRAVAYFSAGGTTRGVAEKIAGIEGIDLFEIVPVIPYTVKDLNWMDKNSRSSLEMSNRKSRPEIADIKFDISQYNEIFLGFPIWWYEAPRIINTFLEKYSFCDKKIIPFATSGGSGFGNTIRELQSSAPGALLTEGKILNNASKKQIEEWLKTI